MSDPPWLRFLIGFDTACEAPTRGGKVGVTVSSRIATACAHGHAWGERCRWLLERFWPLRWVFGPGHCRGAIRNDRRRAEEALAELNDPVVCAWLERDD